MIVGARRASSTAAAFVLLLVTGFSGFPASASTSTTTVSPPKVSVANLQMSVPDALSGCSIFDGALSDSMQGVLDLTTPSAFVVNRFGRPLGASGPITQSELISVSPQVVQYRINPHFTWTTGQPFTGEQMVQWWEFSRRQVGSAAVNYRSISSLVVSTDGLAVTATFSLPNSGWSSLFRDMQIAPRSTGCSLAEVLREPQLGPYQLVTLANDHAVLVANPQFAKVTGNTPIAQRIEISAGGNALITGGTFAVMSHRYSQSQLQFISSPPTTSSFSVASSTTERLTFSATRPQEASVNVRSALASAIDRASLVWKNVGLLNPGIAPAASSRVPQSSPSYPGPIGTPVGVTTTTSAIPTIFQPSTGQLNDCGSCAPDFLRAAGFTPTASGWTGPTGPLILHLAVGPTTEDRMSAAAIATSWQHLHAEVSMQYFSTEVAVLGALRSGHFDAGVYHLPQPLPSELASRWAVGAQGGSLWTGWDPSALVADYQAGLGTLNSVTATASWKAIDDAIQRNVWDRPLYSLPNIEYWSSRLPLQTASNVVGLLDEFLNLTPASLSS